MQRVQGRYAALSEGLELGEILQKEVEDRRLTIRMARAWALLLLAMGGIWLASTWAVDRTRVLAILGGIASVAGSVMLYRKSTGLQRNVRYRQAKRVDLATILRKEFEAIDAGSRGSELEREVLEMRLLLTHPDRGRGI